MREIFQALEGLHERRPEVKRSPVWYVEKIRHEESHELLEVTYNEPTPEQIPAMLSEGADVILCVVDLFRSVGVSPDVALQAILQKVDEIGQRPSEHFRRGIRNK